MGTSALGEVLLKAQTPEGQRRRWWPLVLPCHIQRATWLGAGDCSPLGVRSGLLGSLLLCNLHVGHDLAGS